MTTTTVSNGQTVTSTTVTSGNELDVLSGGAASATTVLGGGLEVILLGGFELGATLSGTAFLPQSFGVQNVFGSAVGVIAGVGGQQNVESGGVAIGTTVNSNGEQDVFGLASNAVISNGGVQFVSAGGVASGTFLGSGGLEAVFAGGMDFNATIAGDHQHVFGTAVGGTIQNGGVQFVDSGGFSSATTVLAGGLEQVFLSGTTVGAVISGGTVELQSGGDATGGIDFRLVAGGRLIVDGATMPTTTVSGFVSGDAIDLANIAFDSAGHADLVNSGSIHNQLQITESGTTYTFQLDPNQDFSGDFFHLAGDGTSGTLVSEDQTACYCRGTMILTPRGEVPIETLAIGDHVATLSGRAQPIKWIGRRSYDGRFISANRAVLPIRVATGAIATGMPARDLWISPEHALYVDGVLVPARLLLNGASIAQADTVDQVDYFHLELETHDIVFAEGAPAETYVDCDNRGMFQNATAFAALAPGNARRPWDFCAKRVTPESAEAIAIHAQLAARARLLGYQMTTEPDPHLIVDGKIVRAQSVDGAEYRFTIPAGSREVWLASRTAVPAEVEATLQDRRRLGAPIERLVLSDAALRSDIGHAYSGLSDGFHDDEGGHRWTSGLARLPGELLRPFTRDITLEVHLAQASLRYPLPAPTPAAA